MNRYAVLSNQNKSKHSQHFVYKSTIQLAITSMVDKPLIGEKRKILSFRMRNLWYKFSSSKVQFSSWALACVYKNCTPSLTKNYYCKLIRHLTFDFWYILWELLHPGIQPCSFLSCNKNYCYTAECCHIAGVVQSRLFHCTSGIQTVAADRSCMACDGHLLKQQKMFHPASDCCSLTFEDNNI